MIDAYLPVHAADAGDGEKECGVDAIFIEFLDASVQVTADVFDLQVREMTLQLSSTTQRTCTLSNIPDIIFEFRNENSKLINFNSNYCVV